MVTSRSRIEDLLMEIQDMFLESPQLTLTLPQAQKRFGCGQQTCLELLGTLVEAGVLMRTDEGTYVRFFPGFVGGASRSTGAGPMADGRSR